MAEQLEHLCVTRRPPCSWLDVTAPFDGTLIAQVPGADSGHVEDALAAAHEVFRARAWLPVHERVALLKRVAALMSTRADDLALCAAQEGGKPLMDSRVEVSRAIDGIELCVEALRGEEGEVIPMAGTAAGAGRIAFTRREPIGVVVAVSAFNHPLNLIVHQVAAAVAAGCPVIVKPANDTPLSCMRFVQILHEAGLSKEWAQVLVTLDNETAEALVTDERVAFFSFIGSAKVGWMLRAKLAPGTRCALEHGGVAPLLLAADADLDRALPAMTKGGFYHAGQVCVSVQRVFAPAAMASEVAERLAAAAGALKIGDPTDAQTDVGPLIRHAEVDRIHDWVREAVVGGGRLITGGNRIGASCYECTVVLDPPDDCRLSTLEIFGPVVAVFAYTSLDAAIEQANSLPFAFQAAVFTGNLDTALDAYDRLDASAIMVNDHTAFRVDAMPFAGLRQSGLGVGGIPHTIRDMSIDKMLVIKR